MERNDIYKKKISRPFQKSLIKAGILVAIGCALYPFSEELGSLVVYTSLGAFIVVSWYYYRVKKRVKRAVFKKVEASDELDVKTEDGIKIRVSEEHKDLYIKEKKNGDVDALLAVGVLCSDETLAGQLGEAGSDHPE